MTEVQDLPGYRRRIRIEPRTSAEGGAVLAMLEDDMHCMAVTLRHEGGVVTAVEPVMERAPWTTCPGAGATDRDIHRAAAERGHGQAREARQLYPSPRSGGLRRGAREGTAAGL